MALTAHTAPTPNHPHADSSHTRLTVNILIINLPCAWKSPRYDLAIGVKKQPNQIWCLSLGNLPEYWQWWHRLCNGKHRLKNYIIKPAMFTRGYPAKSTHGQWWLKVLVERARSRTFRPCTGPRWLWIWELYVVLSQAHICTVIKQLLQSVSLSSNQTKLKTIPNRKRTVFRDILKYTNNSYKEQKKFYVLNKVV